MAQKTLQISRSSLRAAVVMAGVAILGGCGSDNSVGPKNDILWNVSLAPRAITLAVGDSMQLTPTIASRAGVAVGDSSSISYSSGDETTITISPTGKIKALQATFGVPVPVALKASYRGVTLTDTAYVAVATARADVAQWSYYPIPGSEIEVGSFAFVMAMPLDADGIPLSDSFALLESSDKIWPLDPVAHFGVPASAGKIKVRVSANIFGKNYTDSVDYTITNLKTASVSIGYDTVSSTVTAKIQNAYSQLFIAPGAVITFRNTQATPVSIHFSRLDGTSGIPADIATLAGSNASANVTFPQAGAFEFTVTSGSKTVKGRFDVQ